jgi:hypothetical protein
MLNNLNCPNLQTIGGTLNLIGQKNVHQQHFPKLQTIGGDLHLALTAFTQLPTSLITIEGNVFLVEEPKSLVVDCLLKKQMGIIKGDVFLVGGKITTNEEGEITYEEKIKLNQ